MFTLPIHSDASTIAKQYQFNLTIPTAENPRSASFRLEKKSFAIACSTTMTSEIERSGITQKIQTQYSYF